MIIFSFFIQNNYEIKKKFQYLHLMKPYLLLIPLVPNQSFSVRNNLVPNFLNRSHYHIELELVYFVKGIGTQFFGISVHRSKP